MRILSSHRSSSAFVIEVTVGASETVSLPLNILGSYNFNVIWGDGSEAEKIETWNDPLSSHTYTNAGTYQIRMIGELTYFTVDGSNNLTTQLTDIIQWGRTGIQEINFQGCNGLNSISVRDVLDTSNMTRLFRTFSTCSNLTYVNRIGEWDISNLTELNDVFYFATSYNCAGVGNWNTNNITSMPGAFRATIIGNEDLSGWCSTGNLISLLGTFEACSLFKGNGISNWDMSNVTNLERAFRTCAVLDEDLSFWNITTELTNLTRAFQNCYILNCDISGWDVSEVTVMLEAFYNCYLLTSDLENWDVGSCINFNSTFRGCRAINFNCPDWDVDQAGTFASMFRDTDAFNGTLTNWVTTAATNMSYMFSDATAFNQPVNHFDLNGVTTIEGMFYDALIFNQPLNLWNVTTVQNMQETWRGAEAFDQNINNWITTALNNLIGTWRDATSFNQPLNSWNVSGCDSLNQTFFNAESFNQNLLDWVVTSVTDFTQTFSECDLFNGTLTNWVTSAATTMDSMFSGAHSFNQSVNHFNVSLVTNFNNMFFDCDAYNQDMGLWVLNANIGANIDMTGMFYNTLVFEGIGLPNWNVTEVIDYRDMFRDAIGFNQDLSGWNIAKTNGDMVNFATGGSLSTENWGAMLIAWKDLVGLPNDVHIDVLADYPACQTESGSATSTTVNKLVDNTKTFITNIAVGFIVYNETTDEYAEITAIDNDTTLSLDNDIMVSGNNYSIEASLASRCRYELLDTFNWQIDDTQPDNTCLPNTFIGGVGATSITNIDDYASIVALSAIDIAGFTIDVNNNVSFKIEKEYTTNDFNGFQNDTDITYFIDAESFLLAAIDWNWFSGATNLEYLYLPGHTTEFDSSSRALWAFNTGSQLKRINIENMLGFGIRDALLRAELLEKLDFRNATSLVSWDNNGIYGYGKELTGLNHLYLGGVTSFEFNDYPIKGLYFEELNSACKVYYNPALGAADRNAYARLHSATTTPFDVGDTIDIDGLTYTAVNGAPATDGEFDAGTAGADLIFGNLRTAINTDTRNHSTGTITSDIDAAFSSGRLAVWVTDVIGASANAIGISLGGGNTGDVTIETGGSTFVGGTDVDPNLVILRDVWGATLVEVDNIIAVNTPTGLTATGQTNTTFVLNFTEPAANANGTELYEVWVSENNNPANPKNYFYYQTVNGTGETITGLDPNKTYTVQVRTQDGQMQYSGMSSSIQVSTINILAFPSADGTAAFVTGGRGGSVYHVTNLNDMGAGSFRDAVSASNRIIVFDVSGTIELASNLTISSNNLTIAGHTAPYGGIAVTGEPVYWSNADNIMCRYVRFRPNFTTPDVEDALNASNLTNAIFDHCSISWGGDEAFSFTGTSDKITVQDCIIGESRSGMITGDGGTANLTETSILRNLWYNISHRFPNTTSGRIDIVNNVVHNWFTRLRVISVFDSNEVNEINNYYQPGVTTGNPASPDYSVNWLDIGSSSQRPNIRIYTDGNVMPGYLTAAGDDWTLYRHRFDVTSGAYAGISQWDPADTDFQALSAFPYLGNAPSVVSAAQALLDLPLNSGANKYMNEDGTYGKYYDAVDDLYIQNVRNNTSEAYVFPPDVTSKQSYIDYHNAVSSTPIAERSEFYDASGDGMPDVWKIAKGLDPTVDDSNYVWPSGYVGCEEFLNEIDDVLNEAIPAFDSAYGFAKKATGGRNQDVYKVTNLNDTGAGSLRQALADSNTNGGGHVHFDVAGTITVATALNIPNNTTINGQTAYVNSGEGITLRTDGTADIALSYAGSNVVVRHMRFRRGPGDGMVGEVNGDSLLITSGDTIIMDHCSFSWSTDELVNLWGVGVENITFQNCIFSEGLFDSTHNSGTHSRGPFIGNTSTKTSFYLCLIAHNNQRNPLWGGGSPPGVEHEMKNCLIYNWGSFGTQFSLSPAFRVNLLYNKWKVGSNTNLNRYACVGNEDNDAQFYVEGNISPDRPLDTDPEWDLMGREIGTNYMEDPLSTDYQVLTPFAYPLNNAPTLTIANLEVSGLADMGASLFEDSIDTRIKGDYTNGTGSIIDDPSDVGGYPALADLSSVPTDTSGDGMPDTWKIGKGLVAANDDTNYVWPSGYIGPEEYYNEIG